MNDFIMLECYQKKTFFVATYNYQPLRLAKANIPKQNFSLGVNDICDGSPSRIRMVRRISFGITTRPRSSHYVKRGTKKLTIFSKSPVLLGF